MIGAILLAAGLALAAPAGQGTAPEPALPDAAGADPEMVCFSLFAGISNDAAKANKPDTLAEGVAGFYFGRISQRYPDTNAKRAAIAALNRAGATLDRGKFRVPCMDRYLSSLTSLQDALKPASTS